jgi:hypothetical protein
LVLCFDTSSGAIFVNIALRYQPDLTASANRP